MVRGKNLDDKTVLSAARDVLLEHGLGASTKFMASRAGVSEGVLFQRFDTKKNLVFRALTEGTESVPDFSAPIAGANTVEKIHTIAEIIVGYFRAVLPGELLLMTHPEFDVQAWRLAFHGSPSERLAMSLIEFLEREDQNGSQPISDPMASGVALMSCLHSACLFELQGAHGGEIEPEFIHRVVDAICSGLFDQSERTE